MEKLLTDYENEVEKLKRFTWRIDSFSGDKMRIRIDFDTPNWIAYMDNDILELSFNVGDDNDFLLKCSSDAADCPGQLDQ